MATTPEPDGPGHLSDEAVDASFRELIAAWRDGDDGGTLGGAEPARAAEDTRTLGEARTVEEEGGLEGTWSSEDEDGLRGAMGPRDWLPEDDEADEDYVPPEPEELPSADDDMGFWATGGFLAAGVLMLLYAVIVDRGGSPWWPMTGIALLVTGFVMLVLRSGSGEGPDMGARV